MSTTTIRIPDELKARLSRIAEHEGTSTHGLIIEAIAEKADALEQRQSFYAEAEARYAKVLQTGLAVTWEDMREYFHIDDATFILVKVRSGESIEGARDQIDALAQARSRAFRRLNLLRQASTTIAWVVAARGWVVAARSRSTSSRVSGRGSVRGTRARGSIAAGSSRRRPVATSQE